ncbi:uncharacterized protein LOC113650537 [Tachysurus fulvidraco]|uniref:uncharacterized protein LOC113650537 n=1 Tax=Tachysurus fulvidraco TaxID=1234273 RepID=UPI001FED3565|nr:uncharacterized protein LOC113650537 [Tachysurus fulvidraco]
MDSKIANKTQSLTTAEEMRNQTKLVMQPYANWEEYLTPAPLSIAILGELVFISSNTDFSINKNKPIDGYKFIKYPESFRACLMQVCNSGWCAFNEAHKNMDQIRLHTIKVPDYMKSAVKILFQGSDEAVEAHLPKQLENIRVVADECLELADSTEKRFTDVINIIRELLEACLNAEHFYGEELEEIKKKLEEAKLRKQSSEEAAKRSEKSIKDMQKHLNEAHESYSKAMDSQSSFYSHAQLDKTREMYEKSVDNMKKNQKELTDILITMRNCEIKEIDFNTTIKMLVRGMDVMGRVKEQWKEMVRFFQMVSNIVKISLTLKDFVSTSEETQKLSYNTKLFSKDLLYNQAFQATNITNLVNMIATTYTEVFTKHIMYSVSIVGKLMVMDKEKPEFQFEVGQLRNACDGAHKAILVLVLKNKREFEEKSLARLEKIYKELLAILPAAAP